MLNKLSVYNKKKTRIGLVKRLLEDSMVEEYWAFEVKQDLLTGNTIYIPIKQNPGYYYIENMILVTRGFNILTRKQLVQMINSKKRNIDPSKAIIDNPNRRYQQAEENYQEDLNTLDINKFISNNHSYEKVKKIN